MISQTLSPVFSRFETQPAFFAGGKKVYDNRQLNAIRLNQLDDVDEIILKDTQVRGTIDTPADVTLEDQSNIRGSILSDGDVTLTERSRVTQKIEAGGDLLLDDHSRVKKAEVQGKATLTNQATVTQALKAYNGIEIKSESKANNAFSMADIRVDDSLVSDRAVAAEDLYLTNNANVMKMAVAGGDVSVDPDSDPLLADVFSRFDGDITELFEASN